MSKDDGRKSKDEETETAQRALQEMLRRLQDLPKPSAVEARDTEPLLERPGL